MRKEFLKNDHFHNEGSDAPVEFEMSDYDTAKRNSPYLSEQEFTEDEDIPPGMEPVRAHLDQRPTPEADDHSHSEQRIKQEPNPEAEVRTHLEQRIKQEPNPEAEVEPTPTELPKISNESKKLQSKLNGPYWTCNEDHGRRSYKVSEIETTDETAFKKTWDNVIKLDEATSQENWIKDINNHYILQPPNMQLFIYLLTLLLGCQMFSLRQSY